MRQTILFVFVAIVALVTACAAPGVVTVQPETGKRFLQWQAREACEAVYLPTGVPNVYLPGIRCP